MNRKNTAGWHCRMNRYPSRTLFYGNDAWKAKTKIFLEEKTNYWGTLYNNIRPLLWNGTCNLGVHLTRKLDLANKIPDGVTDSNYFSDPKTPNRETIIKIINFWGSGIFVG